MSGEQFKIYKLKIKSNGYYQLPLSEVYVTREIVDKVTKETKNLGHRKIVYVKGAPSIWEEDISGNLSPKQVWFEKGLLYVPINDLNLIKIMELHPWLNVKYELVDEEKEFNEKLESLRFKTKIGSIVEESDEEKQKAISIALFGVMALAWGPAKCEYELRLFAENNPLKLQETLNGKDYQTKYLAALAFAKNIVTDSMGKDAVIWNDSSRGVIVKVAKGQNGINTLADFLSERTDESLLVLQTLTDKVKKAEINLKEKDTSKDEVLAEKDKEIALLREQLAAKNTPAEDGNVDTVDNEEQKLLELRAKFEDVVGPVPNNMKNNIEWLTDKINAKEAE
ncbi:hypothetical protein [Wenyingzhuangia sp. 2_MG-2023]|uniref:hypothetical protein n=1 Tax=Wenyingzhuangia sp. 2_MG-2023 TaxID=3062639 RepID=UPI0026E4522D|nr:hypothetical protein [Wenyingzhuangia sp. 2_MG-2023]MDO6737097.1 hypothetical protein [Wenyingzhuangia sp. 2_MG-2023]